MVAGSGVPGIYGGARRTVAVVVMLVTEVVALPAIAHSYVVVAAVVAMWADIVAVGVIPTAAGVAMPCVAAAITGVEHRPTKEEVVAMGIACIDAEMPETVAPDKWAEKVCRAAECLKLPTQKHITQVEIAALPVDSEDIVVTRDTHQVVEIYLVGSLVLLLSEIQFVGHLVGEKQSLVAGLLITHCLACCCYQQHCQDYHHLLHSCSFWVYALTVKSFTCFCCKEKEKKAPKQRFFPKYGWGIP